MSTRPRSYFLSLANLKSARPRSFLSPRVCAAWGRGLLCLALCVVSHPVLAAAAEPAPMAPVPNAAPAAPPARGQAPGTLAGYRFLLDAQGLLIMEPSQGTWRTLSTLALPGEKAQLVSQDGFVYVACGSQGIAIVDVSRPERPVLRALVAQGHRVVQLSLSANMLLALLQDGRSALFDLGTPGNPKLLRAPAVVASLSATEPETPPLQGPQRRGRPGLGLTIAGASMFGGLYTMMLLWSGVVPELAIPIAGALVAGRGSPYLIPVGILAAAAQTTGLILFAAGLAKMYEVKPTSPSQTTALRILPYAGQQEAGLVAVGRF